LDLLRALRVSDRDDLRSLGVPRRYRAGTTVFCEGEPSDSVVIIERGRAKVTSVGGRRQGRRVVDRRGWRDRRRAGGP